MAVTSKGRELAWKLNPAIGITRQIEETCSLISRHATTYARLAEEECNGPAFAHNPNIRGDELSRRMDLWQRAIEERQEKIEKRIAWLVDFLPDVDGERFTVSFTGDPRGYVVKIVPPGEWVRKLSNTWGMDGLGVA